jgi:UDP-glucose 4-epimerase
MKTSTQTSMLVNGAIGTVGSEIVKQLSEKEIQIYKISKISSSQNYEKPESYNKLFGVDYRWQKGEKQ